MIIRTNRLTLRPFTLEDINWYFKFAQDEELVKELKNLRINSLKEAENDIKIFSSGDFKNDFYYVVTDDRGNVLGIIIAVRITQCIIDVSYFLKKEYRHRGYMHEALEKLMEVIRIIKPLYCFRMTIALDNTASINVAKGLNAVIRKMGNNYICCI